MFIDSGKVTYTWGKESPVMTTREELKKEAAKKRMEKINCSGLNKSLRRLDKNNRARTVNS